MNSIWNRIKLAITARERKEWNKAKDMGLKRYFFINGTYKGTLVGLFCLCLDYISSINFRFMSIDLETLFRKYLVWLPLAILLFILILVLSYYNFESKYGNDETKQ